MAVLLKMGKGKFNLEIRKLLVNIEARTCRRATLQGTNEKVASVKLNARKPIY